MFLHTVVLIGSRDHDIGYFGNKELLLYVLLSLSLFLLLHGVILPEIIQPNPQIKPRDLLSVVDDFVCLMPNLALKTLFMFHLLVT